MSLIEFKESAVIGSIAFYILFWIFLIVSKMKYIIEDNKKTFKDVFKKDILKELQSSIYESSDFLAIFTKIYFTVIGLMIVIATVYEVVNFTVATSSLFIILIIMYIIALLDYIDKRIL